MASTRPVSLSSLPLTIKTPTAAMTPDTAPTTAATAVRARRARRPDRQRRDPADVAHAPERPELLEEVCDVDVDLDALDSRAAAGVRTRLKKTPGAQHPTPGSMGESDLMLDTHAVARSLTAADFTPAQADAITDAMREFTERGDHVTPDQFKAGQAEVRSEITELRSEQRTQIAEVRTEIAEVRTEIANLDTRLSTQIAELRAEQQTGIAGVRTEIAEVRTEIASLETRLIRWMVGTVLATAALTVGILRFLAGSGG